MSTPTPTELRDLLLHRLPEAEAQRIEELLIHDPDVAEALRLEEIDLLDDYAMNRLTSAERAAVEKYLLVSPIARQRIKVSRALQEIAASRKESAGPARAVAGKSKASSWNRWPMRAAAVFVLCLVAVTMFMKSGQDSTLDDRPAPMTNQPDTPAATTPASEPFNVVLLADLARGVDETPVSVVPTAGTVQFQVETENADLAVAYRIRILDSKDDELFAAENLTPHESAGYLFVEAELPASILGTGSRKLILEPLVDGGAVSTWQLEVRSPN